jgi:hypothetical protein
MNKLALALGIVGAGLAGGVMVLSQTADGRAQLVRGAWRHSLPDQFPDLARELDITPSSAGKFFDLLDEHIRRTLANQKQLWEIASPLLDPSQHEEYWRVLDQILMREVALTRGVGMMGTAPVQTDPVPTFPARR